MSDVKDFVIENGVLVKYIGEGGDVVIPDGVVAIGKKAFFRCNNIRHIVFSECVTVIEPAAFEECSNVEEVILPKSLTEIGSSAFKRCSALTSITVPENVCKIGDGAFSWCNSLKTVILPEGLKKIGKKVFMRCKSLGEMTLPKTVKTISDYAFADTDICGEIAVHPSSCPLLTILGTPKISDLAFGSSIKRSGLNAPPMWFVNMPLGDVPNMYKKAAAKGFMIVWHNNRADTETQKEGYIKYLRSQRKKYYDDLVEDEKMMYLFLKENILSKDDIISLMDVKASRISTEIKALLLEFTK